MFELLRWTTVHPALVHLPLGILPLSVFCYAVAFTRRSGPWTFAADVAAWAGAISAVIAGLTGIVAYAMVPWPGGLAPWPIAHLLLGGLTVLLSSGLVIARVRRRPGQEHAGALDVLGSIAVVLVATTAGWVGGEVLVFHAGMAVRAAGQGALAPLISWSGATPADMDDAMGKLRSSWASASTTLASAVVERPDADAYATLALDARRMQQVATWMATELVPEVERERPEDAAELREGTEELRRHLTTFHAAAQARDLAAMSQALGQITGACAGCHHDLRWTGNRP